MPTHPTQSDEMRAYDGSRVRWGVKSAGRLGWQWWAYTPKRSITSCAPSNDEARQRAKAALREDGVRV